MNPSRIEQITVYTDVELPEHIHLIEKYAKRLCPRTTNVVLLAASPTCQTPFLKYWLNDTSKEMKNSSTGTAFMSDFECFITGSKDLRSGEVIYALYQRQMPVLSLHIEPSNNSNHTSNEKSNETPLSSTTMNVTPLQEVLYRERRRFPVAERGRAEETLEEAVQTFFDFPSEFGCMIAIESNRRSTLHLSRLHEVLMRITSPTKCYNIHSDFRGYAKAIGEMIRPYLGTGKGKTELDEINSIKSKNNGMNVKQMGSLSSCFLKTPENSIWLRSDGYPLPRISADKSRIIKPPPPLFHVLKQQLLAYSSNPPNLANSKELEAQPGPFFDLLQQDPQLYSALCIFDRYGNRCMLRYLLQRGYTVFLIDHMSTSFQALLRCLPTSANSDACTDGDTLEQNAVSIEEAFYSYTKSLFKFESHWLEMPTPSAALFLSDAADEQNMEDNEVGITTSRDCWLLNALSSLYGGSIKIQNTENSVISGLDVLILGKNAAGFHVPNVMKPHQHSTEKSCISRKVPKILSTIHIENHKIEI